MIALSNNMQLALIFSFSYCLIVYIYYYKSFGNYFAYKGAYARTSSLFKVLFIVLDAAVMPATFWIAIQYTKIPIIQALYLVIFLVVLQGLLDLIKIKQFSLSNFFMHLVFAVPVILGTYLIFLKCLS